MKRAAVMLLLSLAACGGEARRHSATVDTAVALPYDTFAHDTSDMVLAPSESLSIAGPGTVPMNASTAVVLRADSAAGYALYHGKGRCFTCHGVQADGMATLGPSLMDTTWLHGDGSLRSIERVIASGIAAPVVAQIAMPAFGDQLTPAEIHRTAAYVYSLTHPSAVVGDTTTVDGTRTDTTTARAAAPPVDTGTTSH